MATYNLDIDIKAKLGQTSKQIMGIATSMSKLQKATVDTQSAFSDLAKGLKISTSLKNISKYSDETSASMKNLANSMNSLSGKGSTIKTISSEFANMKKSMPNVSSIKAFADSIKRLDSSAKKIDAMNNAFVKISNNNAKFVKMQHSVVGLSQSFDILNNGLKQLGVSSNNLKALINATTSLDKSLKTLTGMDRLLRDLKTLKDGGTTLDKLRNAVKQLSAENLACTKSMASISSEIHSTVKAGESFNVLKTGLSKVNGTLSNITSNMGKFGEISGTALNKFTSYKNIEKPFLALNSSLSNFKKSMSEIDKVSYLANLPYELSAFGKAIDNLNEKTNVFKQSTSSTKTQVDSLSKSITSFNALSGNIKGFQFGTDKLSSDFNKHATGIAKVQSNYKELSAIMPSIASSFTMLGTQANTASSKIKSTGESSKKAKKEVDRLAKSNLKGLNSQVKGLRNSFSDLQQIVKGILISQVFYRGIGAVREFSSAVLDSYMSVEQLKASLELFDIQSITGDAVGELTKFSEKLVMMSGVSDRYINQAIRQWSSLGYTAEQTEIIMTSAANAATMSGRQQDFEAINRALRQIRTNGKLMGEELNQLGDAGIEAKKYIKEAFNLSSKDMANLGKLNINSDQAIQAIVGGIQRDFGGAMEKMADTTRGALNQIKSTSIILFRDIYNNSLEAFSGFIKQLRDVILLFRQFQTEVTGGLKNALLTMIPPQVQEGLYIISYWLGIVKATLASLLPYLFQLGTAFIAIFGDVLAGVVPILGFFVNVIKSAIYVISNCRIVALALATAFVAFNFVLPGINKAMLLYTALTKSVTFQNLKAAMSLATLKTAYIAAGGGIMGVVSAVTGAFTAALAVLATNPLFWALLGGGLIVGLGFMANQGSPEIADGLGDFMGGLEQAQKDMDKILNPELEKTTDNSNKTAQSLQNTTDKLQNFGDEAEEAGNKAKKASAKLLSFDEIFQLTEDKEDEVSGLGDIKIPDIEMPDLDTSGLTGKLDGIQDDFSKFKDWMLQNASSLNTGMIDAWNWGDTWGAIKGTLEDIFFLILEFPLETVVAGIKVLGETLKGLASVLGSTIKYGWEQFKNWGGYLTTWFSETASATWDWTVTMLGHIGTWLSDSMTAWDNWVTDSLAIWQNWFSTTLQIGAEWCGQQLLNIGEFLSNSLTEIGTWCGDTIANWATWSVDSLGVIGWFTKESAIALGDWIVATGGDTWQWCKDTASNFATWSVDAWSSISTWGSETWSIFSGWFGDTVEGFSGWVGDALESLFNFENWSISSLWDWVKESWNAFWSWGSDTKETFSGVSDANDKMFESMGEANKKFGSTLDTDTANYQAKIDKNSQELYGKVTGYASETSAKLGEYWEKGLSEQDKINTTFSQNMAKVSEESYEKIKAANEGASKALSDEWDKAWTEQIKTTETRSQELSKASETAWTNITTDHKKIWGEWDKNINDAWTKTIAESNRLTNEWKTSVGKSMGEMTVNITKVFEDWWKSSANQFMQIGNGIAETLTGGTGKFEDGWQKSFEAVLRKTDNFKRDIESKMSNINVEPRLSTSTRNPFQQSRFSYTEPVSQVSRFRYTPPNVNTESVGSVTQTSNGRKERQNMTVQLTNEQISMLSQNNNQPLLVVDTFIGDDRGLRELDNKLRNIREENRRVGRF